jgi:hypothetical protein
MNLSHAEVLHDRRADWCDAGLRSAARVALVSHQQLQSSGGASAASTNIIGTKVTASYFGPQARIGAYRHEQH